MELGLGAVARSRGPKGEGSDLACTGGRGRDLFRDAVEGKGHGARVSRRSGQSSRMPLLIADRAVLESPLPIHTTSSARALGIRLDARWHRLRKGIYVNKAAYDALPHWKRYALRVHAYRVAHPDAILCLESAAVIHGLPSFGETRYIHVYDPSGRRSQRFGDVQIHTSATPRAVVEIRGILVTALVDTVVDLARVMNPADALAVADAALSPVQGGSATAEQLILLGEEARTSRGRARMRWVWAHADGRSESPTESVSRATIIWSGFEPPELQREFRYEGHTDRCDFLFESCQGIGEADGWSKYGLRDPKEAAERLADEKRREDRLRRHRHPFARWETRDAWRPDAVRGALIGAGIRPRYPRQLPFLATLGVRPRAIPLMTPKPAS